MEEKPQAMPTKFWQTLNEEEWKYVMNTGELDAKLCQRLWRLTYRQGPPPQELTILVRQADVTALINRAKK